MLESSSSVVRPAEKKGKPFPAPYLISRDWRGLVEKKRGKRKEGDRALSIISVIRGGKGGGGDGKLYLGIRGNKIKGRGETLNSPSYGVTRRKRRGRKGLMSEAIKSF